MESMNANKIANQQWLIT